jgi:nucleotide-binding universal stress UspA family protein
MYRRILVAYNGTPESRSALHECIHLTPDPAADIHLLGVVESSSPPIVGDYGSVAEYAAETEAASKAQNAKMHWMERELLQGQALLKDAGLNAVTHLEVGQPVDVISDVAEKLGIELVIVGHSRHQSWATRWWRGSTDAMLIEKVPCAILIAPGLNKKS